MTKLIEIMFNNSRAMNEDGGNFNENELNEIVVIKILLIIEKVIYLLNILNIWRIYF